ncbi:MAG: hypothetical protein ACYCW6_17510, partial [Candidatus Xenobia bacterium]
YGRRLHCMTGTDIFLAASVTPNGLLATLAEVFGVPPDEVWVGTQDELRARWQRSDAHAVRVLCVHAALSGGEFPCSLEIDCMRPVDRTEVSQLCRRLGVAGLITDETSDPYTWILADAVGMLWQVAVEPDALDREGIFIVNRTNLAEQGQFLLLDIPGLEELRATLAATFDRDVRRTAVGEAPAEADLVGLLRPGMGDFSGLLEVYRRGPQAWLTDEERGLERQRRLTALARGLHTTVISGNWRCLPDDVPEPFSWAWEGLPFPGRRCACCERELRTGEGLMLVPVPAWFCSESCTMDFERRHGLMAACGRDGERSWLVLANMRP